MYFSSYWSSGKIATLASILPCWKWRRMRAGASCHSSLASESSLSWSALVPSVRASAVAIPKAPSRNIFLALSESPSSLMRWPAHFGVWPNRPATSSMFSPSAISRAITCASSSGCIAARIMLAAVPSSAAPNSASLTTTSTFSRPASLMAAKRRPPSITSKMLSLSALGFTTSGWIRP
jgi:hypothetical protein